MNYSIEWVGTGSGLNPVLGNTSFLVNGENKTLLVDCGCSVPIELIKKGRLKDITDVVITHLHADHIGGMEGLGFMSYFAYKKRDAARPNLYLASEDMKSALWNTSLKGGMEKAQMDDNTPFDAVLETYFNVNIGRDVRIEGLPEISFFPTKHVQNMENYGLDFGGRIFYSGDTLELPRNAEIIFQDCQFYESPSDVHVSYDKLKRELANDVKSRTYLVHLGGGWDKKDAKLDGFAGFVKPGDIFRFE